MASDKHLGLFRQIFSLAQQLEPDRQAVWAWLTATRIDALGGQTALELAFAGEGARVLALLESAVREEEALLHP